MALNNRGGRPPKPTAVKVLDGTKKDRINHDEPTFETASPVTIDDLQPPSWMKDRVAREWWDYHAPIFFKGRVLTEADVSLLNLAAERWAVYRHAADDLNRRLRAKLTYNAASRLAHTALMDYLTLAREFGVGAASRTKIRVEKPEEKKDQFAEMFE